MLPSNSSDHKNTSKTNLNAEARRQAVLQRLGCDNPRCVRCGENDPFCLELHHIAGQTYDTVTVTVCRNCHRQASDMQRDHPSRISDPPSLYEQVGHFLLGLADLFSILIEKCRQLGTALIASAKSQSVKE
jgi:hypothetical protein